MRYTATCKYDYILQAIHREKACFMDKSDILVTQIKTRKRVCKMGYKGSYRGLALPQDLNLDTCGQKACSGGIRLVHEVDADAIPPEQ